MVRCRKSIIIFIIFAVLWTSAKIIGITYLVEPSIYEFYKDIEITEEDRILILAPHPDDEAICTSGIIQKAIDQKASVKVVFLTSGDHNQLPFLLYMRNPLTLKKTHILLGETRMQESIKANQILGLSKDDLIFLGYPDFGTLNIMLSYWDTEKPFRNILNREVKVPYEASFTTGSPYTGENILADIKKIILDFNPTKIFVSSPFDANNDHRALFLFLQIAIWDLEDLIGDPEVFTYLVHAKGWPKVKGYRPSKKITHPDFLDGSEMDWYKIELVDEEIQKKYQAISSYRSQISYNPSFLVSFAREDEIFGRLSEINLEESNDEEINWYESDVFRDGASLLENVGFKDIFYSIKNGSLLIKVIFKDTEAKSVSGSVYLLGYDKDKNFAKMPKIHIKIGVRSFRVLDKRDQIKESGIEIFYEGSELIIEVPLIVLGKPSNILASIETKEPVIDSYPHDKFLWRVINMKN